MSTFGSNFRELRRGFGLSQEEISERLGVTSQAISKWECERSYPDLDMLIHIAHFFDVSLDALLTGNEKFKGAYAVSENARELIGLPDDDLIRVVLCKGKYILKTQEGCNAIKMPLVIDGEIDKIEIRGSADISGNVYGSVSTGTSLSCGAIEGSATVGTSVDSNSIIGDVVCGGSLRSTGIEGDVVCGGSLWAEAINGHIQSCTGDINAEVINGDIKECKGNIYKR
ncbi:MAG: helix-turn-helix domain-containing protein [Clostridia bacterium]|nr:helix-turn-helix domain-containing protein [Clostridia bacterium]